MFGLIFIVTEITNRVKYQQTQAHKVMPKLEEFLCFPYSPILLEIY